MANSSSTSPLDKPIATDADDNQYQHWHKFVENCSWSWGLRTITTKPINHPSVSSTYRATIYWSAPSRTTHRMTQEDRDGISSLANQNPSRWPHEPHPRPFAILNYGSVACHPAKYDGRPRVCALIEYRITNPIPAQCTYHQITQ